MEKKKAQRRKLKDSFVSIKDPSTRLLERNNRNIQQLPEEDIAKIKEAFLHNSSIGYSPTINCFLCGIGKETLNKFRLKDPVFREAEASARDRIDGRIIEALSERALGFYKEVQKPMLVMDGDGMSHIEVVKYEEYFPPDLKAITFWLCNRRPHEWSLTQTLNIAKDKVAQMNDEQLIEAVYKVLEDKHEIIQSDDQDDED